MVKNGLISGLIAMTVVALSTSAHANNSYIDLALSSSANQIKSFSVFGVPQTHFIGQFLLTSDDFIESPGCGFVAALTDTAESLAAGGSLATFFARFSVWWSSNTDGSNQYAVFQNDGNLVIYRLGGPSGDIPVWASGTNGHGGSAILIQQDDGNLVIYQNGTPLWASGRFNGTGQGQFTCSLKQRLWEIDQGYAVNTTGNNVYETISQPTATSCALRCAHDASCTAFNYDTSNSNCSFISVNPDFVTMIQHQGIVTGVHYHPFQPVQ